MPLWGIAHPRSQILRFPPRSASDIYCQFWALFQNGPFSYLAAERLEFRRDNIFHFVVVQAKEYQGVATSKLVYNPDIRDDGRYLACRVLPTSKAGKSLEDTWEIKVLCESKSESFLKRQLLRFWIKKGLKSILQTSPKFLCGWEPPWTLTTCGQVADNHLLNLSLCWFNNVSSGKKFCGGNLVVLWGVFKFINGLMRKLVDILNDKNVTYHLLRSCSNVDNMLITSCVQGTMSTLSATSRPTRSPTSSYGSTM